MARVNEVGRDISVSGREACFEVPTPTALYHCSGGVLGSTVLIIVQRARQLVREDARIRVRFGLTKREAQIARMLADGKSNADIAEALAISTHTARHHTGSVIAKLGLSSRAQVASLIASI